MLGRNTFSFASGTSQDAARPSSRSTPSERSWYTYPRDCLTSSLALCSPAGADPGSSLRLPLHLPAHGLNTTPGIDALTGGSRSGGNRHATLREVELRAAAIILITGGCGVSVATGVSSPIRVVLVLSFLLFAPGLALAELLETRDLAQRVAIATAASLSIETLVAVTLVYARAFSMQLVIAILTALTVSAVAVALLRARRCRLGPGDRSPPPA